MEGLLNRYDGKSMGLYDYSQFGGKDKSEKCEKYNNFKELYLKTKKELDEANKKIKKLEEKLNNK